MSVPQSVRDSLVLEAILDVEDSGLLKGYETRLLRTPEALAEILRECGENPCLTDPVSTRDVGPYAKFAREMHGVGLVDYNLHCFR